MAIRSRQLRTFCGSRGSSKRRYYFTYFLLYSAHHYPIPYSLTSPKDWRRVKLQERERETEVKGRNEVSVSLSMSEVIEGRVANGAVSWGGTAWNTKLPSLGFVLNSTGFKSGLALSSLS